MKREKETKRKNDEFIDSGNFDRDYPGLKKWTKDRKKRYLAKKERGMKKSRIIKS